MTPCRHIVQCMYTVVRTMSNVGIILRYSILSGAYYIALLVFPLLPRRSASKRCSADWIFSIVLLITASVFLLAQLCFPIIMRTIHPESHYENTSSISSVWAANGTSSSSDSSTTWNNSGTKNLSTGIFREIGLVHLIVQWPDILLLILADLVVLIVSAMYLAVVDWTGKRKMTDTQNMTTVLISGGRNRIETLPTETVQNRQDPECTTIEAPADEYEDVNALQEIVTVTACDTNAIMPCAEYGGMHRGGHEDSTSASAKKLERSHRHQRARFKRLFHTIRNASRFDFLMIVGTGALSGACSVFHPCLLTVPFLTMFLIVLTWWAINGSFHVAYHTARAVMLLYTGLYLFCMYAYQFPLIQQQSGLQPSFLPQLLGLVHFIKVNESNSRSVLNTHVNMDVHATKWVAASLALLLYFFMASHQRIFLIRDYRVSSIVQCVDTRNVT